MPRTPGCLGPLPEAPSLRTSQASARRFPGAAGRRGSPIPAPRQTPTRPGCGRGTALRLGAQPQEPHPAGAGRTRQGLGCCPRGRFPPTLTPLTRPTDHHRVRRSRRARRRDREDGDQVLCPRLQNQQGWPREHGRGGGEGAAGTTPRGAGACPVLTRGSCRRRVCGEKASPGACRVPHGGVGLCAPTGTRGAA